MVSFKQDAKTGLGAAGLVTLAVIFVCVLGFGIWGASVLLSNVTGAGNAIKTKNSSVNRIGQQAYFEDLAANHPGYVAKIKVARQTLSSDGTAQQRQIDRTNLEGLQQQCIDNAQEFNAASRKYLARDWKSAGLPATLDPSECTS